MPGVAYGTLPFKQQIAFFRGKENVLTDRWDDVWEAEHDASFMVAGANRMDLLADFREAVRAAVDDHETLEQFRARFDSIVAKHGWDYNGGRNWRSRVIYETNMRQSYNAGRYAQQMALRSTLPYIQYHHSDAVQHPRPVHLGWNGKVWRADDPIWNAIYPANGWGCQCYTSSLSERDLQRLGKSGPDPTPQLNWIDAIVGKRSAGGPRVVRTVEGVDPGFSYAPGASLQHWPAPPPGGAVTPPVAQRLLEETAQDALRKSARLPAATAAKMLRELFGLQRAQDALEAGYAEFQATVLAAKQPRNASYVVGMLEPDLVDALGVANLEPTTATIVARDAEVLHTLRDAKPTRLASGKAVKLTAEELAHLPSLLRNAQAVLLDPADESLLYVVNASDRRERAKVIVAVNLRVKLTDGKDVVNSFRTSSLIDLVDVRKERDAGSLVLLRGSLE